MIHQLITANPIINFVFTTKTRNYEKSKGRRMIEKHDSFRGFALSRFRD